MRGVFSRRLFSVSLLALSALIVSPAHSSSVPVVVELFTSQGCGACPPADALLGELTRRSNIVALAYHVDYWDERGWKDAFSIPQAAQRQRGYVKRLSRAGVFTPHIVVSGDSSLVGSNRSAVLEAINEDRDALGVELSKSAAHLLIKLPDEWNETLDVHVVTYLAKATAKIGRGENANKTLTYHNIVRSFERFGAWNGKPQTLKLSLAKLPRDATSVAVLLQRPRQGAIAGAAVLQLR